MLPPASLVGTTIDGKYRVERVLGQGGMGVVVAARHLRLGQLVAIKFPLSTAKLRGDAVERLLREARAAMRIRSEHVAKVHDVGLQDGAGPYLVMEYLAGRDLGTVLAQDGPLQETSAVEYVLQACEALAEAHAKGIVHRDLKPANMFLSRRSDGAPLIKVIDFGLAKTLRDEDQVTLTKSGAMLGSPLFMAPEQMRGSVDVDARADIWALGATLYALLVGEPPFPGRNLLDVHERIKLGSPQLTKLRPEVSSAVDRALLGCLKVDPVERYRSVADFAEALVDAVPTLAAGYGQRVRRILESTNTDEDANSEGDHSQRIALAAAFEGEPGTTAQPLSASWMAEPPKPRRDQVETGASLSVSTHPSPARVAGRSLLMAIGVAAVLGAAGAALSLFSSAGTTGRGARQSGRSAAVSSQPSPSLASNLSVFSASESRLEPSRDSPSPPPDLASARTPRRTTSTAPLRRQVQAAGKVTAAKPRDPLAEPD